MRVDLLYALHNRSGNASWNECMQEARDHAVAADKIGFDGIWLGEHHFDVDGVDACPNPVLMMADLAARTERLRLGMAAVQLTLWHPLRLAEDLAMLDHMSGGRLEPAFARGIVPFEVMNINPEADRWSDGPAKSEAIFEENFQILRKAMTEEHFKYSSDRFKFPYPGLKYRPGFLNTDASSHADADGNMISMGIVPQPLQKPFPPMYAVTESLSGFENSAKRDIGAITWYPTGKGLKQLFEAYQKGIMQHHNRHVELGDRCGVLRIAYVAKTDAEAKSVAEEHVVRFASFCNYMRRTNVWVDIDEDPKDPRWTPETMYELLMERDHLLIGSPDTVLEQMTRMSRDNSIKHWLLQIGFPGLNSDEVTKSIDLFGKEVLPELKKIKN
jgi:alkanesulfonate monooxygenase SsuD/methylene tetrahydromethanopterin reductase-like flavin-dependent oxidoreductase (luciferase family)